jgi:hypothetical protein
MVMNKIHRIWCKTTEGRFIGPYGYSGYFVQVIIAPTVAGAQFHVWKEYALISCLKRVCLEHS